MTLRSTLITALLGCTLAARNVCVCPNGTPVFGAACTSAGATACMYCAGGFHLTAEHACEAHTACGSDEYTSFGGSSFSDSVCQKKLCVCPNGVPAHGAACATHGAAQCASCTGAYHLEQDGTRCALNDCHCDNGTPASAASGHCTAHNANICSDCNTNFHFKFSDGLVALQDDGYSPDVLPLGNCKGDCDRDDHCAHGYVCYQNNYHTVIPGCAGAPKEAMDYCVKATDECEAHKECDPATEYETFPGASKLDRECALLSTCDVGEGASVLATATNNVQCAACKAGTTFSAVKNGAACADVSAPCGAGFHTTAFATAGSDLKCDSCAAGTFKAGTSTTLAVDSCAAWATCAVGEGQSTAPTAIGDRQCATCQAGVTFSDVDSGAACVAVTTCTGTEYEHAAPTANSDRGCSSHTTCNADQYIFKPAATKKDRVCRDITTCAKGEYATKAPTGTSNRVCSACPAGMFKAAAGNEACAKWAICPVGLGMSVVGSATANRQCAACKAGATFSGVNDGSACQAVSKPCNAGSYMNNAATVSADRTCDTCADGSFKATAGNAACVAWATCNPGQHVNVAPTTTINRTCKACAPNTFSTSTNAVACAAHKSCDLGEYEIKAKSAASDRVCAKCAPGTFSDYRNADECQPCSHLSSHQYQPDEGQSACINHGYCPAGQMLIDYTDADAGKCADCGAGRFKSSIGGTPYDECTRCYRGRFSAAKAVTCSKCAKGKYNSQYGQASCTGCPRGRYVDVEGRTSLGHCDYCPSGKFADVVGTDECTSCVAGTMGVVAVNNDHENHCIKCEAGKFQEYDGSTHCAECASGTYTPTDGHDGCLSCDVANGQYSGGKIDDNTYFWTANKAGAKSCQQHPRDCKPNDWNGSWNTCTASCGGGVQQETRTPAWSEWGGGTPCSAFEWKREQTCNEHKCPIDCKWNPWGNWEFGVGGCSLSCGGGFNKRERTRAILTQNGGKQCAGDKTDQHDCNDLNCPEDCVVGSWGSWPTCSAPCNGGSQTRTRTNKEPDFGGKKCPSSTDTRPCQTQCCKGHFHTSPTSCEKCTAGQFAAQEGVPRCSDCPVGTYQPGKGFDICVDCPKGRFNTNKGSTDLALHCLKCAKGKYAEYDASEHCADCVEGKFNANEAGDSRDACLNCIEGQFAAAKAAEGCEECPVGQYNDEDSTTASVGCKACGAGRYNPYKGRASAGYCYNCKCGQWSTSGSNVCAHCARGQYRACSDGAESCAGGISSATCSTAEKGHTAQQGSCDQSQCQPGEYMADEASHFCSKCAAGKFSKAGAATSEATCQICPAGTWSSNGATSCTSCTAGRFNAFSNKGAVAFCLECAKGTYAAGSGATTCASCGKGQYQTAKAASGCTKCGSGTSSTTVGSFLAADCADCNKGHYQPDEGKDACIKCAKGTYENNRGSDKCTDCAAGTFNMFHAQTSVVACRPCAQGSYSASQRSTSCTPCGIGRASNTDGANSAAHCVRCAAGSFADVQGLAECKACKSGTYGATGDGASDQTVHCLKCAKGQFQKFDGATTCEKCAADTYTPPHSANHDMKECIACAVVDAARRYSTNGVAGSDHCVPVPVDCKPSPWGAVASWSHTAHTDLARADNTPSGWSAGKWSTCTKSCGRGQHTQTRHPVRMPSHQSACGLADQDQCNQAWGGGKECDHSDFVWSTTDDCNEHECPVDCVMHPWGHWEPCTESCGVGGTYRTRGVKSREQYGGKKCLAQRDPVVGLSRCNEHTCSDHPATCGLQHVRCNVLMLEHHKSNFGIRGDLSTCGHSAIEEQNTCWNNDSCKSCKGSDTAHSNIDHCHKEACHDADTDSERALHARLERQYNDCLAGTDGPNHAKYGMPAHITPNDARAGLGLPAKQCRKLFPTLQVTHDRENMEQLGKFKCTKDSDTTCSCKCDRHPPCCATKNKLLSNAMVFGNRFTSVAVLQDCCNMCTNHPECTAWEYTSEKVCILKHGIVSAASYLANPLPLTVTTWAGTPSGVGAC